MAKRVKRSGRSGSPLHSSIRSAWGLQPPPGRGPRPTLSLGRIVEAGVAVASSEGLEAVAMHRVARELDVGTMSLYRHVEGKDDLLVLMADAVFDRLPVPPRPREGWRSALARWAREHLAVLRRHPWVLQIPISGPPITPNQVRWFEHGLRSLGKAGLTEAQKPAVLLLVNGFVRNHAMLEADLARAADAGAGPPPYGEQLAAVVDLERFPAISALLAARVFDGPHGVGADFEFGLERILDGIAAIKPRRR